MYAYYIEVNMICIIILALFKIQLKNTKTPSADQRILNMIILSTILFCFSDMVAGVYRGATFNGAREIIEVSNLIYFEAIAIVSYLWNIYVDTRLAPERTYKSGHLFVCAAPLLVFTVIAVTNPHTHFLFKINEQNLYERNSGIYLHWVLIWGYFIFASIKTLRVYLKETNRLKKREIAPLLYFMVAPASASIVQMAFYGVTTTQVGITVSIVMICLSYQDTQILTDALTGINNRRGFDYYIVNAMQHSSQAEYTLVMIDVDRFKHINDKYGHMVGDLVLQSIAEALKRACRVASNRLYLCRFGGDEFIIVGANCASGEIKRLQETILLEISKCAEQYNLPCAATVSIGISTGSCATDADIKAMISKADEAMYSEKAEKKKAAQKV